MREPSPRSCIGSRVPALVVIGLCCALPAPAWAYVDPNAGGLLYQILFPLIVAIGAAWAGLRYRIGSWWARLRGHPQADEPAPSVAPAAQTQAAPGPEAPAEPENRSATPAARQHD
jgi:hypothetical protein